MDRMTRINNDAEWKAYKDGLDKDFSYKHRHYNDPEQYPCLVSSEWNDDPNGPYYFIHELIYRGDLEKMLEQLA